MPRLGGSDPPRRRGWPGAILPNGDLAGGGVLFGLRFGLDLYANIRPAKLYPGIPHLVNGEYRQVQGDGQSPTSAGGRRRPPAAN